MSSPSEFSSINEEINVKFNLDFTIEETIDLLDAIKVGQMQKVLNTLSVKQLDISEIKAIIDFVKNKNGYIEESLVTNKTTIKSHQKAISRDSTNKITISDSELIKKTTKTGFLKLFGLNKFSIFKSHIQDVVAHKSELVSRNKTEKINEFIEQNFNTFLDTEKNNCLLLKRQKNQYEIDFQNKKTIILFRQIKSAHLKNKDVSRIQLSANNKPNSGQILIPVGVDLENKVFVFWNPIGFIQRFENNKNTSFYSSFKMQHQARITGILEHSLSSEIIHITDSNNFRKQLLVHLNLAAQNNSEGTIESHKSYRVEQKYCDKLSSNHNLDQISNWLSTIDEKQNRRNPFNNYRGIRTLEFEPKRSIPAFFIFVTTNLKRRDDNANIWDDKYYEDTGLLVYHGDAKPKRELYHSQNHGNCRIGKVMNIAKLNGSMPPIIYFVKTRKNEMEFKGIFKVINIEEFNEEVNGNTFKNLRIKSQRDLSINEITASEIVSIRLLDVRRINSKEWYNRNCTSF